MLICVLDITWFDCFTLVLLFRERMLVIFFLSQIRAKAKIALSKSMKGTDYWQFHLLTTRWVPKESRSRNRLSRSSPKGESEPKRNTVSSRKRPTIQVFSIRVYRHIINVPPNRIPRKGHYLTILVILRQMASWKLTVDLIWGSVLIKLLLLDIVKHDFEEWILLVSQTRNHLTISRYLDNLEFV